MREAHKRDDQTEDPGASVTGSQAASLPPMVLQAANHRLGVTALLCAAGMAVSFPVMNWSPQASAGNLGVANAVAIVSIVVALGMWAATRWAELAPPQVITLGLAFEVVMGFGVGLSETFASYEPFSTIRGVSWLCLWIALFPLILPSTPGRTLIAALLTATAGPVSMGVVVLAGAPPPTLDMMLFLFLPNYFAAGLAVVASRTLYELRSAASRARRMGSYQLVELLGRGGMGEVWRATHRMLARPAAIKLVSSEALMGKKGSDARSLLRRFRREAKITAQLTSVHTIQLFDFGVTEDGTLYYVMELLEGVDLESLVHRSGPMPVERAVALLGQVCESLAEAHQAGLVHRDVKPANIYVCRLGTRHDCAKVLDFGLVAVQQSLGAEATRLTGDGQVTGTPAYMAPELVRGDREADERVDVYALGCVAYFMLTGQLVFEGDTPLAVLFGHVEKEPVRPSRRAGRELPADVERVVMDCLSKDPADRPRDARELGARLAACDVGPWTEQAAAEWWAEHGERARQRGHTDAFADTSEIGLSLP